MSAMNATPSTAFVDKDTTSNLAVVDCITKPDSKVEVSLAAQQLWCDIVYKATRKGYLFNGRIHSGHTVGVYPYNFTENMQVILADTAWMNHRKPTEEHGRVLCDLVDELWRAKISLPQVVGDDPPEVHFHLAITDQLRRAFQSHKSIFSRVIRAIVG
jgi:hypothetical protein